MSRQPTPDEIAERQRQGATLRELRLARGIQVTELARALHVHKSYIANVEAGRRRLTPVMLSEACRILGVRPIAIRHPDALKKTG